MGLGLDDVLLARNALESFAKVRVRPVLIGDVEEADPLVDAWRTTLVNPGTPRRVWLLACPEPTLPVPIPTRETWTPDLPRVAFSVGLLGRLFLERPVLAMAVEALAASAAVAVACERNSRRCRGGFTRLVSPVSEVS